MRMRQRVGRVTLLMLCGAMALLARSAGAPVGVSGAPGDGNCTRCHQGKDVNSGPGNVTLSFANGTTYTPGQTQRVKVTITDPTGQRWGFEVSPRVSGDAASTTGAGTLAPVDDNTHLQPSDGTRQWITHTSAGTRPGTSGPTTFEFDWTAPATDIGPVDFYAAANAANNSGDNRGDTIYTTKATLTPATAGPQVKPAISDSGVVNGASLKAGVVSGSWITIFGSNLATSTRIWKDSEIVNGKLPTSMDGTTVTVNGKPAAVYFISPTQINAQAPDDTATGNVNVVVGTAAGESAPMRASLQQFAPAFFPFDPQGRKYAASVGSSDGALLGPSGLFGTAVTTRPVKPGEVILLFGTGFGPTSPAVAAGQVFSGAASLANPVRITIGGVAADVAFAGLSGAGLYQFNVTVPATVPNGDQAIVATIGGVSSADNVFVAVQK